MPDHLAFLERNAAAIAAAGPLRDPAAGVAAGGLWIVEAADRATVEILVHTDPFWSTGLRRSVRILAWNRVFADGRRR
ncbi:MAG: YciI family protein [Acidiphilium sp.]